MVTIRFRSRDRDACSGRPVRQTFRAICTLAPRSESWVAIRAKARKLGGGTVRFDRSDCAPSSRPRPPNQPGPPAPNCQGYRPCLSPGPDIDCRGGGGNGPRYVDGPVRVNGSDSYDLDRDGDGVACE
jgi:hypothetical protein